MLATTASQTHSRRIIKALSVIMLNTSFDKKEFLDFFNLLCQDKKSAKEKYIEHCEKNHHPCELINTNSKIDKINSISTMIELGEIKIQNKYKGVPKEKQRMFELITLFAKTSAIVPVLVISRTTSAPCISDK